MSLPTKTIAGVSVLDTPLTNAAQQLARDHADNMVYNHVMRSWLFGTTIGKRIGTLSDPEAVEVQAIAALLHDLGWDSTGEFISKDKRFEVDGAIAAKNWLDEQVESGLAKSWDKHQIQLVWDSIALHGTPTIVAYKEPVVATVAAGIASDFRGPESDPTGVLTWDEFNAINKEFPRLNLGAEVRKILVNFCVTKPQSTYGLLASSIL
jgi:hypothetical protein